MICLPSPIILKYIPKKERNEVLGHPVLIICASLFGSRRLVWSREIAQNQTLITTGVKKTKITASKQIAPVIS